MSDENAVKIFRLEGESGANPLEGVNMRAVIGERGMLNVIELKPDAVVPLHSHPHEQLGMILEGIEILIVDGVEHELRPLDAYVIPSGVEHAGRGGPDGCVGLDIFIPVRDDYRSAAATPIDAVAGSSS